MKRYPTALSIAGSDSCGGAGIQADLKTFSAWGVYGMTAITAITAQNTLGVRAVQSVAPEVLKGQMDAVFSDFTIDAIKTGMLNDKETVKLVVEAIDKYQPKWVVVDPVMVATSGSVLLKEDAIELMVNELLPRATLVTPNIPEAECISGVRIDRANGEEMAKRMVEEKHLKAVLLKGGHLDGEDSDDLFYDGKSQRLAFFRKKKIGTSNTHGTGCTLSAAITAGLALGLELREAIAKAEDYIAQAIAAGADVQAGHGHGPVNHLFAPQELHKITCG